MSGGASSSKGSSTPQATPQQMVEMYTQYLPGVLKTMYDQASPAATSIAGAMTGANPIYTQSGLDQLQKYAPGYQKAGADLSAAQSASNAELLRGSGGDFARAGAALTNELNPAQAAANRGAASLVDSYNMNGLSPGEANAVERSTNQANAGSGNLGLNNTTNIVKNAMNFGDAFNAKRAQLGQALGAATGVSQAQSAAFNPLQAAMGSGSVATNFGLGTYNPTQAQATAETPWGFGSTFGSQLAGVSSASSSNNRSSSAQGGISCCFIFLEAQNGVLPWFVRECRDEYYKTEPLVAKGYKRMAKLLVPLMRHVGGIKSLVNTHMVLPITKYGGWLKKVEGYEDCEKYGSYKTFWFTIWKLIGRI